MSVALDAVGTALGHTSSASTFDFTNLTVGSGSNRALVALLTFGNKTISGLTVTWDPAGANQPLALITAGDSNGVTFGHTELWGLVAPASGNKILRVSWTTASELFVNAIAVTGADQTGGSTTFANFSSANPGNGASSLTLTIPSASDRMSVATWVNRNTNMSSVSDTQIYINNVVGTDVNGAANYRTSAAGSTTLSMNCGFEDFIAGSMTDIVAAGSGGGGRAAMYIPGPHGLMVI